MGRPRGGLWNAFEQVKTQVQSSTKQDILHIKNKAHPRFLLLDKEFSALSIAISLSQLLPASRIQSKLCEKWIRRTIILKANSLEQMQHHGGWLLGATVVFLEISKPLQLAQSSTWETLVKASYYKEMREGVSKLNLTLYNSFETYRACTEESSEDNSNQRCHCDYLWSEFGEEFIS